MRLGHRRLGRSLLHHPELPLTVRLEPRAASPMTNVFQNWAVGRDAWRDGCHKATAVSLWPMPFPSVGITVTMTRSDEGRDHSQPATGWVPGRGVLRFTTGGRLAFSETGTGTDLSLRSGSGYPTRVRSLARHPP